MHNFRYFHSTNVTMQRLLAALTYTCICITVCIPCTTNAQDITDTLFYDLHWQICERIPATYYRIGTMRIDSVARYIGPATDYYMNGQPEMKATYNNIGDLHGNAVFYYPNGNPRMEGNFNTGEMTGRWTLYNENGTVRAIMNCKNAMDFAPLFLANYKGKPVLTEGDRKFRLETKDFSDFLSPAGYKIEGEVRNGLREGTWKYSTEIRMPFNRGGTSKTLISEQYVRGRFIRAIADPDESVKERRVINRQFSKITLSPPKLLALDMLRSDFVFRPAKDGRQQLRAFLVAGRKPIIRETPVSPDQNFSLFARVITEALMKKADLAYSGHARPGRSYTDDAFEMIRLMGSVGKDAKYNAQIHFLIQPNGVIDSLVISGRIDDRSCALITHYLSSIRNLYVNENQDLNRMTLFLQTRTGTSSFNPDVIILRRSPAYTSSP